MTTGVGWQLNCSDSRLTALMTLRLGVFA
jgi:hypothetical protein